MISDYMYENNKGKSIFKVGKIISKWQTNAADVESIVKYTTIEQA